MYLSILMSNVLLLAVPENFGLPLDHPYGNHTNDILPTLLSTILHHVFQLNTFLKQYEGQRDDAAIQQSSELGGPHFQTNTVSAGSFQMNDNPDPLPTGNETWNLCKIICSLYDIVNSRTTDKFTYLHDLCYPDIQVKCFFINSEKLCTYLQDLLKALDKEEKKSIASEVIVFLVYLGLTLTVFVLTGIWIVHILVSKEKEK
ncbi:hypothetical protein R5R35_010328 [Gryllus longicercus]|uniref:Uncharacterized protein n=1 Tax=Gryllus longicercus TaxID=2509291 RepID=A0AAN9W0T1_9ORTH